MLIKQISVFVENRPGSLFEITKLLKEKGIDMRAFAIADTTNFGIMRLIVDEADACNQMLRDAGFTTSLNEIVALKLTNETGALHGAFEVLKAADINVEYGYSYLAQQDAMILLCMDDNEKAAALLREKGFDTIG